MNRSAVGIEWFVMAGFALHLQLAHSRGISTRRCLLQVQLLWRLLFFPLNKNKPNSFVIRQEANRNSVTTMVIPNTGSILRTRRIIRCRLTEYQPCLIQRRIEREATYKNRSFTGLMVRKEMPPSLGKKFTLRKASAFPRRTLFHVHNRFSSPSASSSNDGSPSSARTS